MVPWEPTKAGSVSKVLLMGVWEGKSAKMGWEELGVMGGSSCPRWFQVQPGVGGGSTGSSRRWGFVFAWDGDRESLLETLIGMIHSIGETQDTETEHGNTLSQ